MEPTAVKMTAVGEMYALEMTLAWKSFASKGRSLLLLGVEDVCNEEEFSGEKMPLAVFQL